MIKLKDILSEGYGGHTVKIHIRSLDRNKSDQYPAFLVKLAGTYQDEPIIQFIPKSSKDLDKNTLIRRLGIEYHSADPITLKLYADKNLVNPVFTKTLAAATTKETTNKSLRVGQRARLFMLEMVTAASTNSNVKIEDIEVETDG